MSSNERKHPNIRETVLTLSDSESSCLSSMRGELGDLATEITDFALVRFLRHHSWNVSSASEAWRNYIKWRQEKGLDTILSTSLSSEQKIRTMVPYSYHSFDKENRPIYWEKTGKLQCAALADSSIVTEAEFVHSHVWGMEFIYQKAHEKSLELGQRIDQFTSILDMNGLGFHHRAVMFILKACMDLDSLYYPERIGKLYVLNTPWVAPALYQLVQPLCPQYVKDKVFIVDGTPDQFLSTVIQSENIPVEYGGSCTCNGKAGGCLAELDAGEFIRIAKKVDGLDVENVSYDFVRTLECDEKGGTFTWYFECADGYDIDFTVAIYDLKDSAKPPVYAKQKTRCETSKGSYEATGPVKLVFEWDNNFSYFTSKTVKYSLSFSNLSGLQHSN